MSLKRPAILFAALFIFSAFTAANNLLLPAVVISSAAAVFALTAIFMRQMRAFAVLILCAIIIMHAHVYTYVKQKNLSVINFDTYRTYNATVLDVSEKTERFTTYVKLEGEPYNGLKVVFSADTDSCAPDYYDKISFNARLIPIIGSNVQNPVGNAKNFFLANGYFVTADVLEYTTHGRPAKHEQTFAQKYYFYVYDKLITVMPHVGKTDTFPYAIALLTGDKTRFSAYSYNAFSQAGLTPFLCISGMHVVIACGFLNIFIRRIKNSFVKSGILLCFLTLIAIITGCGGSILRACIMSAYLSISDVFRKNDDGYSSLGIAFCIISAATPFCIYDYSTFLSFVCMMGVLCANYNSSFYSRKTDILLRRPLNTSFYASGFSSLAILSDFGGMYLLSPFSNLAAAVVFTPLMYCLVAIAFLAFLPDFIIKIFALPAALLIKIFELITEFFGAIPFSYTTADVPVILIGIYALLFFVHLIMCAYGKYRHHMISGFLLAALPLISVTVLAMADFLIKI